MVKKNIYIIFFIAFFAGGQVRAQESKFYVKGGIGGGGLNALPLKMYTTDDKEIEIGGFLVGMDYNFGIGYNLAQDWRIEVESGWHKSDLSDKIENGDGYFTRIPLTLSGIYCISKKEYYEFGNKKEENLIGTMSAHIGLGIGYYMSPQLYREGLGTTTTVNYKNAFGYHILVSGNMIFKKIFIFLDLKLPFGVKYEFNDGVENGVKFTSSPFNEWKEIDRNGLLINLGIGFCFGAWGMR